MKKRIVLILAAFSWFILAEAQAYMGRFETHHQQIAVAAIRLPYAERSVKKAVIAYMEGRGSHYVGLHGYLLFRNTTILDGGDQKRDLYFAVVRPIRGDGEMCVLNLAPAGPNLDGPPPDGADSAGLEKARMFLDSLSLYIARYATGERMQDNAGRLRKEQRMLDKLVSGQAKVEKKMRRLKTRLSQNNIDQTRAAADLQNAVNLETDKKIPYQRKLDRLIDKQGDLEKGLRRAEADLRDIQAEQEVRRTKILQLKQTLDALETGNR